MPVFDGTTGDVLYSAPHASCTWLDNPIVADVDGYFRDEIVMGSNHLCGTIGVGRPCAGLGPRSTAPIFAGLRCQTNSDCGSASCVEGVCRCTMDAQCCGTATTPMPVDVHVRVDDESAVRECRAQNNRAVIARVVCPMIG